MGAGFDGDGGSDGGVQTKRCSEEAVVRQHPGMEWANIHRVCKELTQELGSTS